MDKSELLLISVLPDSHRNLSCLSLYAVAASNHIPAKLLFIPQKDAYNRAEFDGFLKNHAFSVVGISVTTGDFYFSCSLTDDIRTCLPHAHVVWGGIHPLSAPEECLDHADSICIGEGEVTLLNLVTTLRNHGDISGIAGIGVKIEGQPRVNPPPHLQEDLSALPFPRYDFNDFFVLDDQGLRSFGIAEYRKYSKHNGEDYTIMTSRSCPHRCAFCINSFLNKVQREAGKIRHRSVDHVLQEIDYARKHISGIGFINFIDDHFLVNTEWTREFCEKYKKQVRLPFMIRATPATIKDKTMAMLREAGLAVLQTGIQSGSSQIHKSIFHRSFNRATVLQAAQILNRYSIKPVYDFIIENDFETDADRDLTIELMLDLPKPYDVNLFVLTVFPKTDLEEMYKKQHMKPRINPYVSDYLDYNENDFYYQLASVIPMIPTKEARFIYRHRQLAMPWLKKLYFEKRPALRNVSLADETELSIQAGEAI